MPKILLSVPHQRQQGDGDCLAACAAMALANLGRAIEYPQLLKLLRIKGYGAPASNIRVLENLGNDPAQPEGPTSVPVGDFELAWLERDYFYALITL